MKHIIRGIERLSNERRRSGSFDRGSGDWDAGASAGPLDQELCLQLVSDLHGAASEVTVARLSQAAAASNLSCDANRAIIVRAGAVVPLVELVRVAGPSSKDARAAVLDVLLALAEDVGDGSVHCQLAFVGLVEALIPVLEQEQASGATRGPQVARHMFAAHRLALNLARSLDGLDGVIRGGAAVYLVGMLAAHERGCNFEHAAEVSRAVVQFHHHLSNDRLIEFATDIHYATLLQAANSTVRSQIQDHVQSLWSTDVFVSSLAAKKVVQLCESLPEFHTEVISSGVIPAMRNILNTNGHAAAGHARQALGILRPAVDHGVAEPHVVAPVQIKPAAEAREASVNVKKESGSAEGTGDHGDGSTADRSAETQSDGRAPLVADSKNHAHAFAPPDFQSDDASASIGMVGTASADGDRSAFNVVVIEAVDLGDSFGDAPLWATLTLGTGVQSTSTTNPGCRHPKWKESFTFSCSAEEKGASMLQVDLCATATSGRRLVGVGHIDMRHCLDTRDRFLEDWITVCSTETKSSTALVKMSCQLREVNNVPPNLGQAQTRGDVLKHPNPSNSTASVDHDDEQNTAALVIQSRFRVWKVQQIHDECLSESIEHMDGPTESSTPTTTLLPGAASQPPAQHGMSVAAKPCRPAGASSFDEKNEAEACTRAGGVVPAPGGPEVPAGWEAAISRSTGKVYYINIETGESQYEHPVELCSDHDGAARLLHCIYDQMMTAKSNIVHLFNLFDSASQGSLSASEFQVALEGLNMLADDFQVTEIDAAIRFMDADGDGLISKVNFLEAMRVVKEEKALRSPAAKSSDGSVAYQHDDAWQEIDLVFEEEGSLGLVFSSETESGSSKVVTEIIPGRLASRVPDIRSAFDTEGKPLADQPALALVSVQDLPVCELGFTEAVDLIRDAGRPLRISLRRVPWSTQMLHTFELQAGSQRSQSNIEQSKIEQPTWTGAEKEPRSALHNGDGDRQSEYPRSSVNQTADRSDVHLNAAVSGQMLDPIAQTSSDSCSAGDSSSHKDGEQAGLSGPVGTAELVTSLLQLCSTYMQRPNPVAIEGQQHLLHDQDVQGDHDRGGSSALSRLVGQLDGAKSGQEALSAVLMAAQSENSALRIKLLASQQHTLKLQSELDRHSGDRTQDIDAATLRNLREEELLEEVGIDSAIHRRRILEQIAQQFGPDSVGLVPKMLYTSWGRGSDRPSVRSLSWLQLFAGGFQALHTEQLLVEQLPTEATGLEPETAGQGAANDWEADANHDRANQMAGQLGFDRLLSPDGAGTLPSRQMGSPHGRRISWGHTSHGPHRTNILICCNSLIVCIGKHIQLWRSWKQKIRQACAGDEEVYEFVIPDEERRVKQRAAAPSLRKADAVRLENSRSSQHGRGRDLDHDHN